MPGVSARHSARHVRSIRVRRASPNARSTLPPREPDRPSSKRGHFGRAVALEDLRVPKSHPYVAAQVAVPAHATVGGTDGMTRPQAASREGGMVRKLAALSHLLDAKGRRARSQAEQRGSSTPMPHGPCSDPRSSEERFRPHVQPIQSTLRRSSATGLRRSKQHDAARCSCPGALRCPGRGQCECWSLPTVAACGCPRPTTDQMASTAPITITTKPMVVTTNEMPWLAWLTKM